MKNSAEKLPDDERDDVIFTCQQSIAAIEAWKQHQLRSIQQDKARTDILAKLYENSVLITQDWAILMMGLARLLLVLMMCWVKLRQSMARFKRHF